MSMPQRRPILAPRVPQPERRSFLKRVAAFIAGGTLATAVRGAWAESQSPQGTSPYLGEIMLVPYNFAPAGWANCDGQLLPISGNTALFSLIGTIYGGDGRTTFALPDLRGRVPIHSGQGPGLSNRTIGQRSGEENHTLSTTEIPSHNHVLRGATAVGTQDQPSNAVPARDAAGTPAYATSAPDVSMAGTGMLNTGGSQAHNNMQPYLAMRYVIALSGVYPSPAPE